MKFKIIILSIFFSLSAYGGNCGKHPIYCQIVKNQSKIDKKYAMKLSNIIYRMHRKYHIPTRVFTAILRQESGYSLTAKGCHSGLYEHKFENGVRLVEERVCTDFGISQIYYKTSNRHNFDIFRLTEDLEYSVEAGAIVLAGFMKRYEAKDNDWWVRYNCGNRGTTKRDTCQIYKQLVERYL